MLFYFEDYFNAAGEKTLRAYTVSLNLARFDRQHWLSDDAAMDTIAAALDHIRRVPLITKRISSTVRMPPPQEYLRVKIVSYHETSPT